MTSRPTKSVQIKRLRKVKASLVAELKYAIGLLDIYIPHNGFHQEQHACVDDMRAAIKRARGA